MKSKYDISSIISIINKYDPEGLISIGCPDDEYDIEAEAIYNIIKKKKSYVLWEEIHEVFKYYFSSDLPEKLCKDMANEIIENLKKNN